MAKIKKMVVELTQPNDEVNAKQEAIESYKKKIVDL